MRLMRCIITMRAIIYETLRIIALSALYLLITGFRASNIEATASLYELCY